LLELALIENVQRADLDPLEEAGAYRQLIDEFGLTQEAVAERVGKSRTAVANTLRLQSLPEASLPEAVRASLAAGEISEGHARALLGLPDDERRLHAWQEVVTGDLTVRQTEELVRRLRDTPSADGRQPADARPKRPTDPLLADLEERLQRSLGTQVRLERSRKGGRIVIRFYGDEDLEALLTRLLDDTGEC
jgi:ParB family chromosome partitioning protein